MLFIFGTMNFQYTIDVESEEPIMLINKHIGNDEYDGVGINGADFERELMTLDTMGKKRIQVWINSTGGMVLDGWSIYSAILKTKTKVDTYCVGVAASIAGVIFQAGRERNMADYALLMYHNPFGTNSDKSFEKIKQSIVTMVANKCGVSEDELSKEMDSELWLDAWEALERKFADSIEMSWDFNKKRGALKPDLAMPKDMDVKARWVESNKILNNYFKSNKSDMKNIANKLGLNPEASEEAIITALEDVQNKVTAFDPVYAELETVKNSLTEKENEVTELTAKVNEFEQKAKDAELENKRITATNMVEGFAKVGKIKNEDAIKNQWIEKAMEDHEFVKNALENLPVNREMPDFGKDDNTFKPYNVAAIMAEKALNKKN